VTDLADYTKEELEAELWRREHEPPTRRRPIKFGHLLDTLDAIIAKVAQDGLVGSHQRIYEQGVFEAAMECVYGENIWDWWRKPDHD
jgi:hypothetical protein